MVLGIYYGDPISLYILLYSQNLKEDISILYQLRKDHVYISSEPKIVQKIRIKYLQMIA